MAENSLKTLVKRRHPQYEEYVDQWLFAKSCYEGGRKWFKNNIFAYHKEGEKEYACRVDRAYRFNHTKEIVDLVTKYIFKKPIIRSEDAPKYLKDFWLRASRNGLEIGDFAKQISRDSSIYGRIWIVVDSTKREASKTRAEEKASGAKIYAYIVPPQDALDMGYDDNGDLLWILIREVKRDDQDPLNSTGAMIDRYRLWDRNGWRLYEVTQQGGDIKVDLIDQGEHNLGVVPVISADNLVSVNPYVSPAMIGDIAYLDRAVANYLSNLDAIIQDQTFSQLAMPAQGLLSGETTIDKLVELGTKRIFVFDGEGGARPEYLSPDPKQAQIIVEVVNKIIHEIYHTVGMAGERTKQDNAAGIDNSSGVAKAYDFERMNALLASKADSLELIENRICAIVGLWHGDDQRTDEDPGIIEYVQYPHDFDVRGLYDEFEIAARLQMIQAPDEIRREQMKTVIDKLFPGLKKELKDKMLSELESWPPKLEDLMGEDSESGEDSDEVSAEGRKATALDLVRNEG